MTILGWAANAALVASWWWMASPRHRKMALALGVAGSLLWAAEAVRIEKWDLVAIEVLLGGLGIRAFCSDSSR